MQSKSCRSWDLWHAFYFVHSTKYSSTEHMQDRSLLVEPQQGVLMFLLWYIFDFCSAREILATTGYDISVDASTGDFCYSQHLCFAYGLLSRVAPCSRQFATRLCRRLGSRTSSANPPTTRLRHSPTPLTPHTPLVSFQLPVRARRTFHPSERPLPCCCCCEH
jgi:hypothetical protein